MPESETASRDWTTERPKYIPADVWERFTRHIPENSAVRWPVACRSEDLTFGVEIETHIPVLGCTVYIGSYHRRSPIGDRLPQFGTSSWQAMRDASIVTPNRNRQDCEFVSPKLSGRLGLQMLLDSVRVMKAGTSETVTAGDGATYLGCGAKVNASCGVHVHVSFPTTDLKALQRLVSLVAAFEPGIYAATGSKRREQGRYAVSTKGSNEKRDANRSRTRLTFESAHNDRLVGLNLTSLLNGHRPAVEFRFFSGSLNPVKVAAFAQLCIGLVQLSLSMSRPAKWDANPAGESHDGEGQGEKEVNRLLARLEWTNGVGWFGPAGLLADPEGDIDSGLPSLQAMIDKLRDMARSYDAMP